jgi:hypothetical protein
MIEAIGLLLVEARVVATDDHQASPGGRVKEFLEECRVLESLSGGKGTP